MARKEWMDEKLVKCAERWTSIEAKDNNLFNRILLIVADFEAYIGEEAFYAENYSVQQELCIKYLNKLQDLASDSTEDYKMFLLAKMLVWCYVKNEQMDCFDSYAKKTIEEDFCSHNIIDIVLNQQVTQMQDVFLIFVLLVLCDYKGEFQRQIKNFLTDNITEANKHKFFYFIKEWLIGTKNKQIITQKDESIRCRMFFFLCTIFDKEQVKWIEKFTRCNVCSLDYVSKNIVINTVKDLVNESRYEEICYIFKTLNGCYEAVGEFIEETEDSVHTYFVYDSLKNEQRAFCELYLLFLYNRKKDEINMDQIGAHEMDCVWEYINIHSQAINDSTAKKSIKFYHDLYKIKLGLKTKDKEEIEHNLKELSSFPYEKNALINEVCVLQNEIFRYYEGRGWDIKDLISCLGENNVFLQTKEMFYDNWPIDIVNNASVGYELEKKIFKEYFNGRNVNEYIYLYMNSNMRYVYRIQDFLYDLLEGGTSIEQINNIMSQDEYKLSARVVVNSFDKKAEDKVKVILKTLYAGCDSETVLHSKHYIINDELADYLMVCESNWCIENKEQKIWRWPKYPFDCLCKLRLNEFGHVEVRDIEIKDEKLLGEFCKNEIVNTVAEWLRDIAEDKIVYEPKYYFGNDKEEYINDMRNHLTSSSTEEKKYDVAALYIPAPSQISKLPEDEYAISADVSGVTIAKGIVTVCVQLKNEPEKLCEFLKMLENEVLSDVNEYRYSAIEERNGGFVEENYQLYHSATLDKFALKDLTSLCSNSSLSANLIAKIYMNTYLRQYITPITFFNTLKKYGKNLKYTEFRSERYKNEMYNKYTFCLTVKDIQILNNDEEMGMVYSSELELFPKNHLCEYSSPDSRYNIPRGTKPVRWLYYKDRKNAAIENQVQDGMFNTGCVRATIHKIDFKQNIIYVKDVNPIDEVRSRLTWEPVYNNFSEFLKCKTLKDIEKIIEKIQKNEHYRNMNFFYKDRLLEISKRIYEGFKIYNYDIEKCKKYLEVFCIYEKDSDNVISEKNINPYKEYERTYDYMKKKHIPDGLIECFEKFLRVNSDCSWKTVFWFYYDTFCYACLSWEDSMKIIASSKGVDLEEVMEQERRYCRRRSELNNLTGVLNKRYISK